MLQKSLLTLLILVLFVQLSYANDQAANKAQKETGSKLLTLIGSCQMVGSSHFSVLRFSTKDAKYSLSGPYVKELENAENITIKITAKPKGDKQGFASLEVYSYEILDVGNGVKPFVGNLVVDQSKLFLVLKDSPIKYELIGNSKVIEKLRSNANGKVWIAGKLQGTMLKVDKFGILKKSV